jgi:plasmid stabilization system protein ParE
MAEIAWTEEAQRWLEDIYAYTVMDALQGQIGGEGKKIKKPRDPIVRNDRLEKFRRPPKLKNTTGGHLIISRLRSVPDDPARARRRSK